MTTLARKQNVPISQNSFPISNSTKFGYLIKRVLINYTTKVLILLILYTTMGQLSFHHANDRFNSTFIMVEHSYYNIPHILLVKAAHMGRIPQRRHSHLRPNNSNIGWESDADDHDFSLWGHDPFFRTNFFSTTYGSTSSCCTPDCLPCAMFTVFGCAIVSAITVLLVLANSILLAYT